MRFTIAVVLLLFALSASTEPLSDHLRERGQPPATYVVSKLAHHRVVIVGEPHWGRLDAELIASIVPDLRNRGAALAMEILPGPRQADIDRLVNSEQWDVSLANDILRTMDWPYVQYRDILHAAWEANRTASDLPPLQIVALGPPQNWRDLKLSYDGYMAERAIDYLQKNPKSRLLVYCGMHHAFTRYLQVERDQGGRATEFMERFGNILWRRFGENVFLIACHKPDPCGPLENAFSRHCAPFGAAIDCAASDRGTPVAFDILGSPFAEMKFPANSYYAFAHPLLRFYDYADGYIWMGPVDDVKRVGLIPLDEFAPDDADKPEKLKEWEKLRVWLARPAPAGIGEWRKSCGAQ